MAHTRTAVWISVAALVSFVATGCAATAHRGDSLKELEKVTASDLDLRFEGQIRRGEAANLEGLRSDDLLLSKRKDSRTYFVQDRRFGVTRSGGVFEGTDSELIDRCRKVSTRLGVATAEIDKAEVVQVMSNVARFDVTSKRSFPETAQRAERFVQLSRRIEGLPVFSSRVLFALDRSAHIGFMELHWPDIPTAVLAEGRGFAATVDRGWKAPGLEGARVESVQAGIVHSPAVAMVLDVKPVIRVVYAPTNPAVSKKPVRYFDAAGRPVALPRQAERMEVPAEPKRGGDAVGKGERRK